MLTLYFAGEVYKHGSSVPAQTMAEGGTLTIFTSGNGTVSCTFRNSSDGDTAAVMFWGT